MSVLLLLLNIVGFFISARQKSVGWKLFVLARFQFQRGISAGRALTSKYFCMIHRGGRFPKENNVRAGKTWRKEELITTLKLHSRCQCAYVFLSLSPSHSTPQTSRFMVHCFPSLDIRNEYSENVVNPNSMLVFNGLKIDEEIWQIKAPGGFPQVTVGVIHLFCGRHKMRRDKPETQEYTWHFNTLNYTSVPRVPTSPLTALDKGREGANFEAVSHVCWRTKF